jgi:hypothetical protein
MGVGRERSLGYDGKNISKRGPRNRRSLGYARDDKGYGGAFIKSSPLGGPKAVENSRPLHFAPLNGRATLPFVIPSEAEGSAVQRTRTGNVFSLLLQNGFHQIARLVHVDAVLNRHLIGQQLQRNDLQHGG